MVHFEIGKCIFVRLFKRIKHIHDDGMPGNRSDVEVTLKMTNITVVENTNARYNDNEQHWVAI